MKVVTDITPYTPRDYDKVRGWYEARGLTPPRRNSIPKIGFIIDNRVAGWLLRTDGDVALIEGIISNPNTVPSLRKQSLSKLCALLVDTALHLGYTEIVGISNHPSILEIGDKLGFTRGRFSLLKLTDDDNDSDLSDDY